MSDPIALLATPAAIIALVNLGKRAGLSGPLAALVAVLLGVALGVADWAFAAADWWGEGSTLPTRALHRDHRYAYL